MSTQRTDSAKKISSNDVNRQVGQYALAAAVAGVSLLAMADPAAAEVVVTRKTIPIPVSTGITAEPVAISLANNGVGNFGFSLASFADPSARALFMFGESENDEVKGRFPFYAIASALPRGVRIGPVVTTYSFVSGGFMVGSSTSRSARHSHGNWAGNLKNHYLGVRFQISGQVHYGWIRVTVKTTLEVNQPPMSATITGYAYETVPNKPIFAGTATGTGATTAEKPTAEIQIPEGVQNQAGPSLGMLAAGAEGMPLWQR